MRLITITDGIRLGINYYDMLKLNLKKEVRDRLKEFDAPSVSNYIDPDTIDKINAAKKPPIK